MVEQREVVDLVDDHGVIQARAIPREEIDNYPDLHLQIVVAVLSDDQGRVLVHQRGLTKKVHPGDIDHVCGGIMSGETPEQAAEREALEETGVTATSLQVVEHSLNTYGRYRYLLSGQAVGTPLERTADAEWIRFMYPSELKTGQQDGSLTFVNEFFEEIEMATKEGPKTLPSD